MKKLIFGIDIGGINSAFGLVDQEGNTYLEGGISTQAYPYFNDYPRYVKDLCDAMKEMLTKLDFSYEIVGIGIGAPNASYQNGSIVQPPNLWKFNETNIGLSEQSRIFPLVEDIQKEFPEVKYIAVTNDANVATIGEMIFGNAKGLKDFVMITLGTGLGSGFVANGELIYGHDGFAGEFGHVVVERGGRVCGCGRKGCLEAYASATGIKRTVFELMALMREESVLRDIPFSKMDSYEVFKAAQNNDPIALEAFRYTGEMLGRALADMATITSPEAIILFGGLAKSGNMIFEPTKRYMEENMFAAFKDKIKILPSGIQDRNIAIIGAAALIWNMVK